MLRGLRIVVSGIVLAGFTLAGPSLASAQEAAKPAPVMALEGDAAVITILIKPDQTAAFESVVEKYKEALAKNDNATISPHFEAKGVVDGLDHVHLRHRAFSP